MQAGLLLIDGLLGVLAWMSPSTNGQSLKERLRNSKSFLIWRMTACCTRTQRLLKRQECLEKRLQHWVNQRMHAWNVSDVQTCAEL